MKNGLIALLKKAADSGEFPDKDLLNELLKDTRSDKDKKIDEMAANLFGMRFSDEIGIDNHFLNNFFEAYTSITFPIFEKLFRELWEKQVEKKAVYGDSDYTFVKQYEGEFSWNKRYGKEDHIHKKYVRVLYYESYVSCAPHTKFIIIQENNDATDQDGATYHIRIVYDKSDYKKGNQYVQFPNLKWYKDRKYCLDYIDELHMTPLGGSYGDGRDKGYVITVKSDFLRGGYSVEDGSMSTFHMYKFLTFYLDCAVRELNQEE